MLSPQPVRNPPRLKRDKTLEVEERRQQCRDRRIMPDDPLQIAACGFDQIRRGAKCFVGDAGELRAVRVAGAEPLTDLEGDRTSEIGMIEDRQR